MAPFQSSWTHIRQQILSVVPRSVKDHVKTKIALARAEFVRKRYGLGAEDLVRFLGELGLARGDVVCVHSSFAAFSGFIDPSPIETLRVLQDVVGSEGTLVMPTLPFAGSVVDFVSEYAIFDAKKTPSKTGLLTEIFRRMPDVHRSVHPTHSAAAWGEKAEALIADHHLARTPCGVPSPYSRLLESDGRILLLGVGILSMTFFHVLDELLEDEMPFAPFTEEEYVLESRDSEGRSHETRTRLYSPEVADRREHFELKLELLLKQSGHWRASRLGTLQAVLLEAKDILEVAQTLVQSDAQP